MRYFAAHATQTVNAAVPAVGAKTLFHLFGGANSANVALLRLIALIAVFSESINTKRSGSAATRMQVAS